MIIKSHVTTNLKIEKLEDLYKLKLFMESANLKINKSQIARELDVDRRTVDKYLHGFHKSKHRTSSNCLTPYSVINTGKMVHQNLLMKILKQSRKLRVSMSPKA